MRSSTVKIPRIIGIAFNLRRYNHVDCDDQEEFDEPQTITALKREIERYGFKVLLYEQNESIAAKLRRDRPDFVLNIAEGIGKGRARESQVPAILESLKIPYSGSDPVALGLTLDKYWTSCLLSREGVPVADIYCALSLKELPGLKAIFYKGKSFIVKPRWEGSSKGIFLDSVVSDYKSLKKVADKIFRDYHQPVVVEEFLEKEEITVGVCGNADAKVIGMMQIVPKEKQNEPFLYSIEIKRDWQAKVQYLPRKAIDKELAAQVERSALLAYRALELRDISRIDFRVGRDGVARVIDINPLPGLSPEYSDLPILYRLAGGDYSKLIEMILKTALKRYGFEFPRA